MSARRRFAALSRRRKSLPAQMTLFGQPARVVIRAFDVGVPAQEAALASLDDAAELERRRSVNRVAMRSLEEVLQAEGFDPAGPAVANFLFVEVGDAAALADRLLREGVIVRPMGPFGAPGALRITAGTPEEIAFFADALRRVKLS